MKILKYIIAAAALLFISYHSVYFEKLSDVRRAESGDNTDMEAYTRDFWENKLPLSMDKAIDIKDLVTRVKADPEETFAAYAHALGIGDLQYFMVKGEGQTTMIADNQVELLILGRDGNFKLRIETELVYGNSVRDASGLLNMNAFKNTSEFNEVSAGLNKIIRKEILPPFRKEVKEGDVVRFIGAVELNRRFLKLDDLEVTPVQLEIVK
ncbi:putative lipoprotein DUF2291 [Arcticibacter pallidicorallinus]|uniref:Putative lipoprotein DUF2291 n=1 Tax=Arcticibacter pallidicorallinus TaxID=1259464 RepID=A0A2T0TUW7_9SPHI|nr:DUF2291 domain-containing protein [Arcticibacter pallidicorallinus]PRY49484.1 putative lipoprotein DUF2291 [Arcticibacter pallidicorallinus]